MDFHESGHGKGPMDGVGAAIKNAIDYAAIAAVSMPDVSINYSADVIPLLHLPNVVISTYLQADITAVKKTLPKDKVLSISWKKFGISKVEDVVLGKSKSNQISWKIMSSDAEYTKALFVTKHVNRRVIGKSLNKTIPSPVTSEMDEGSDSEEEDEDDNKMKVVKEKRLKKMKENLRLLKAYALKLLLQPI